MDNLPGLAVLNLELTSRCNKGDGSPGSGCWMCGRRKMEREYPGISDWGDMPFEMVKSIARQLPDGIIVQFHNNGEPLLYPDLHKILPYFWRQIRQFDTNGKLLREKLDLIKGDIEVITVSVIQDDPEGDVQYEMLRWLAQDPPHNPRIVLRLLGKVDRAKYARLGFPVVTRVLHDPMGSFDYEKQPTRPEYDICLDLLTHLSIDRFGEVRPCVRFDPYNENLIGDCTRDSLVEIWASSARHAMLSSHIAGKRPDFCAKCQYWGVPTGC